MDRNSHLLTNPYPHLPAAAASSPKGMAYFAGTSEINGYCADCEHFTFTGPTKVKGYCEEFRKKVLTQGQNPKPIPFLPHTAACKYFEERKRM